MGLLDDSASIISRKSHHSTRHGHSSHSNKDKRNSRYSISSRKSNRSRSRSRARSGSRSPGAKSVAASFFGLGDDDRDRRRSSHYSRNNASRSSFFGLPNVSTRSFFGGGDKHRSSTSSYRRSPRPSFLNRAYKQLKRLLRDLVYYAKRHPIKVFTLVVLPLLTGGALTALLARFGLRLPPSLERMLGMGARAMGGDTVGFVGEAVRMASGMGGGYEGSRSVRVERGYDGGMQWERNSWEGRGGSGGGWMRSVRNFFD